MDLPRVRNESATCGNSSERTDNPLCVSRCASNHPTTYLTCSWRYASTEARVSLLDTAVRPTNRGVDGGTLAPAELLCCDDSVTVP